MLEELLPEVEAVGKRLAAEAAAARSQLDDVFAELATAALVCCNPACTTVFWGFGRLQRMRREPILQQVRMLLP